MFNYFTSAFWLDSPLWFPLELSCDDPLTQFSGGATNGESTPGEPNSFKRNQFHHTCSQQDRLNKKQLEK